MNACVSCEVASHHKRLYYMAWLSWKRERVKYYEKFIKNPPPTTSGKKREWKAHLCVFSLQLLCFLMMIQQCENTMKMYRKWRKFFLLSSNSTL